MTTTQRETAVISQLLRETQEGKLKWQELDREEYGLPTPSTEARILEVYTAQRGAFVLRLCRYHDKEYTDVDEWRNIESIQLETGQKDDGVWWAFSPTNSTWDLLKAVQFQVTNVRDFFAEVLGKRDSEDE